MFDIDMRVKSNQEIQSLCSFWSDKCAQFPAFLETSSLNESLTDFCVFMQQCVFVHFASWDSFFFFFFSEGKVINRSLSVAAGPRLLLCWLRSVIKMDGNKRAHWVLVPIIGSGSGEQQNLANICHYLKCGIHTSCLKVFYKSSCWEETWRSDLE